MRIWIQSGVLGCLVNMAAAIDISKDEGTMRLLCTTCHALLQSCNEDSKCVLNFLNDILNVIQSDLEAAGALAAYWLLLAALDVQIVRKVLTTHGKIPY